jgi:hypothetical protein
MQLRMLAINGSLDKYICVNNTVIGRLTLAYPGDLDKWMIADSKENYLHTGFTTAMYGKSLKLWRIGVKNYMS